jgi:hypothetical protein
MSTDKAVSDSVSTERALDLALEFVEANHFGGQDAFELITAIKQARSVPYVASPRVQELTLVTAAQITYTKKDVERAFSAGIVEGEKLAIEAQLPAAPAPKERKRQSARSAWVGLDDDDISALGLSIAKARALESLLKRRNT